MRTRNNSDKTKGDRNPIKVFCPFCRSDEVELLALFGQNMLTSQYYCQVCHTPFEAVRWQKSGKHLDLN